MSPRAPPWHFSETECYPGCVLGDYCGDGVAQEDEDCDDGNTLDGDECGSSCRHIIIV